MATEISVDCSHVLSPNHPIEQAQSLLMQSGFADWRAAATRLRQMAASHQAAAALAPILGHLLNACAGSANPDRALLNLQRWTDGLRDPVPFYRSLDTDPRVLDVLIALFAGSQFLTEILLRTPALFPLVSDRTSLSRRKTQAEFYREAMACVTPFIGNGDDGGAGLHAPSLACQRYLNAEMLRIGLGDLGGMLDLSSVTGQLSHLADGIVRACLAVSAAHLHGDAGGFAVLAMGKLGGGELNYSSDIDLIFISDDRSDHNSHYQRLGQTLIKTLTAATGEGFLYRVDMRLRPWGNVGPLVCTRRGYVAYLQHNARLWEKQALLRARTIAGSRHVGAAFLAEAAPFIFSGDMETIRGRCLCHEAAHRSLAAPERTRLG